MWIDCKIIKEFLVFGVLGLLVLIFEGFDIEGKIVVGVKYNEMFFIVLLF